MARTQFKLSKVLQNQLVAINSKTVVVATVCTVTNADLASFADLNLSANKGEITAGKPALLPRARGLFASRNLDGWVEKRKDLSKELREISSLAPDWNGNGHHLVSRTIEAWPLQYHRARLNTISATVLEQLRDGSLVRFRVDQPLSCESDTFAVDLKFNMRLLREAIGAANVYPADMSDEEFAKIQTVAWEMLPPGSVDRILAQLATRNGVSDERMQVAGERLRTLDRLGHDGFIVGTGRFSNYFGRKIWPTSRCARKPRIRKCSLRVREKLGRTEQAKPVRIDPATRSASPSHPSPARMAVGDPQIAAPTVTVFGR